MQRATNGHRWQRLSVKQENAIDLLVTGKTDADVAEAIGVNRVTVTKWRNYHPGFQAELNRRRKNLWGAAAERLRSLGPKALDVIADKLDKGIDRFRAAVQVLKLAGLDCLDPPKGTVDSTEIIDGLVWTKVRAVAAERRKYPSAEDCLAEFSDPSRAKARTAADVQAAREQVLAEIDDRMRDAEE